MTTTTQTNSQSTSTGRSARSGLVGGAVLVLIGVFTLLQNWFDFSGAIFLAALGVIFLAAGLLSRKTGLLAPGGILSGVAAGAYLVEGPFQAAADSSQGGIVMLAMAAGWVLITLLSPLTNENRRFTAWPLIPAALMSLVGSALLAGETGLEALKLFGYGWPVVLIAAGAYLILRRK